MVNGVVQQRGAGQKWFKESPDEQADFEFVVQSVEMLSDVQDKRTDGINIRLNLDAITPELIDELTDTVKENPGNGRLHLTVYNPLNRQQVALTSRSMPVRVTPKFYRWLDRKHAEGVMDFKVVEKS